MRHSRVSKAPHRRLSTIKIMRTDSMTKAMVYMSPTLMKPLRRQVLPGRVVTPSEPREAGGLYWGYTTRLASGLHAAVADSPFQVRFTCAQKQREVALEHTARNAVLCLCCSERSLPVRLALITAAEEHVSPFGVVSACAALLFLLSPAQVTRCSPQQNAGPLDSHPAAAAAVLAPPRLYASAAGGISRGVQATFNPQSRRRVALAKKGPPSPQCAPLQGGYDLLVGTSERGETAEAPALALPKFRHALIAFGGPRGLEDAAAKDPALGQRPNVERLFHRWLNTCPLQGSRTIRTEEAVLVSLGFLQSAIQAAASDR